MEKMGELKSSDSHNGGMDVGAGSSSFPVAVSLDLGERPAREGKEGGTTMFESIQVC
jgi:hypothetical protein